MKKYFEICCICVLAFILTGCSVKSIEDENKEIVELNIQSIEDAEDIADAPKVEVEQDVVESVATQIEVNTVEETVQMDWTGEKLSRAFVNIGNKMYFSQWEREGREAILYEMNIGENVLRKSELEIMESMEVQMMAEDMNGHIHLFMRSVSDASEEAESIIREIDGEGNIVRDVNVSDAIKDRYVLWKVFLVDGEGNYYVKDLDYMICLNSSGEKIWEMNNREVGIKSSFAAAISEDKMYMSYRRDEINYISEIDSKNGTLVKEYPLAELAGDDMILAMEAGTDSELLIYGGSSGIWAWNSSDGQMVQRKVMSEGEIPYNECIVLRGFLEDGRLLLVKNISEGDTHTGITYHYIPGGR